MNWRWLKSTAVFGMNRRNRDLVLRHNSPHAIRIANDKVAAKRALQEAGVPVPRTMAVLRMQRDFSRLHALLRDAGHGFVVKPSLGAAGRGVVLFNKATSHEYLLHSDLPWSHQQFEYHLCRILHGEFTVGVPVDSVLIEEKLEPDANWIIPNLPAPPDLRIIVFQGEAVLAMARLPTLLSQGKANLHQGGVGVGIDLREGRTTHAICHERRVDYHPDSSEQLGGRKIAGFDTCLQIAAQCARAVPLGYLGVDLMWDRRRGPCVLEINARPGLAIQLANRTGLAAVLDSIENRQEKLGATT